MGFVGACLKNFFRFFYPKTNTKSNSTVFLVTLPSYTSIFLVSEWKGFFFFLISLFLFLCVRSQYICQAFGCCSFVGKKHAIAYIVLNLLCHVVFVLSFAFKTLWRICRTLILILFLKKKNSKKGQF